jgi:uncharacterized membrane protein YtjA (UPF0391 family)
MFPWWIVFMVIACVTAAFSLTGLANGSAGTAQVYFFIFIVVTVLFIVARIRGGRRPYRMSSDTDASDKPGPGPR